MATVFKRITSNKWVASWLDPATGKRPERSTRTTDKRLAERLARQWEDEAIARANGLIDHHAQNIGQQELRPLEQHLEEYLRFLEAKGTGDKQINLVQTRLRTVIQHAKAMRITDLTPSAVLDAIQAMRTTGDDGEEGISNQTATHYVRTVKGFSKWMVKDRRTGADMLAHLGTFNVESDRRRVRRDLTPEELDLLIAEAERTPVVTVPKPERDAENNLRITRVRMCYPERAWAYRIAAGTGFRASEVASLSPASFDLNAAPPTITVEAAYSKRRRRDVQPITRNLAERLRPWLATKPADVPVCPLPEGKAAVLLRADLEAARANWVAQAPNPREGARREKSDFLRHTDGAGRVVDFHGLRTTYISRVVETGANLKECMELARHSDPKLTMKTYARVRLHDLSAVLERLPGSAAAPLKPTGTA